MKNLNLVSNNKNNVKVNRKGKSFFKALFVLLSVVFVLAIAIIFIWRHEFATVASIKTLMPKNKEHKDGYVYQIDISGDYSIQEFMDQGGVSNDSELIAFVSRQITKGFFNIPIKEPTIACSSFTTKLENGEDIFARNYDMKTTNIAIVKTNPSRGKYKSISSVDLKFLGIDPNVGISSIMDRLKTLAAAYVPLDGMNEKGLAVGIYMTYQGDGDKVGVPTDQQTDKPDITSTTLLRLMLDTCATVEEAVELAESYDMHDSANTSFHYMVADAHGNSAILEWLGEYDVSDNNPNNRRLYVIYRDNADHQICTNFIVKPGYYDKGGTMYGADRFQLIENTLGNYPNGLNDEEVAMQILASVGRRNWDNDDENSVTTHSVIYNLEQKTVYWVGNEHFGEADYTYRYSFD